MTDAERERYVRHLRFPKELEQAFQRDYYRRMLGPMRIGLVVALALFCAIGLQEFVAGGETRHLLVMYGVGIVVLSLGLALSYVPRAAQYWQHFWVATGLSAPFIFGAAASAFLHLDPRAVLFRLMSVAVMIMLALSTALRLQFVASLVFLSLMFTGALYGALTRVPLPSEIVLRAGFIMGGSSLVLLVVASYSHERAQRDAYLANYLLEQERARTEAVLQNTLPGPIVARLKNAEAIADDHAEATVLFADIADFTPWSADKPAREVLDFLNEVFSRFDRLVKAHGLEKIKTVGDCYMAVAGVPQPCDDHLEATARLALAMQAEVARMSTDHGMPIRLRIGIHTGSLVAGVIGEERFLYDVWGDTVNIASRLEAHGVPGTIQVSAEVRQRLQGHFTLRRRGEVEIKGKGLLETFFLEGEAAQSRAAVPSPAAPA